MHAKEGEDGIQIVPDRTLVLAFATVMEEMLPLLPPGMSHHVPDLHLHVNSESLNTTFRVAFDDKEPHIDALVPGSGLCSMAAGRLDLSLTGAVCCRLDASGRHCYAGGAN